MTKAWIAAICVAIIAVTIYTQLTFFVIQPIGAVPEGRTLLMLRGHKTKFIDSADALCEREMGGVNLLCRLGVLGGVAENSTILLKLPYSSFLYGISTGGKIYSK